MQHAYDVAIGPWPSAIVTIARTLGDPMQAKRFHKLPVSPGRRWQIWEFQSLANATVHKVIAVDIRNRRITGWKILTDTYEQVVQDYQRRIDQYRHHCPADRSAIVSIREGPPS